MVEQLRAEKRDKGTSASEGSKPIRRGHAAGENPESVAYNRVIQKFGRPTYATHNCSDSVFRPQPWFGSKDKVSVLCMLEDGYATSSLPFGDRRLYALPSPGATTVRYRACQWGRCSGAGGRPRWWVCTL